jgi:replicative superfamily II helicase
VKNASPPTQLGIVHAIASCSVMQPLPVKSSQEYWGNVYAHAKKYLHRRININDDRDWRSFQTAAVLIGTGYVDKEIGPEVIFADEETTLQSICYVHGILSGDLTRAVGATGNFFWLLAFASRVAKKYGKMETEMVIDDVSTRLRYGVSQKLVPLCNLNKVGRERSKALYKMGYQYVADIASARASDLADIDVNGMKLGFTIAQAIIDDAREKSGNMASHAAVHDDRLLPPA